MGHWCSKRNLLKLIFGSLSVQLIYKLVFVIYCDKQWAQDAVHRLCDHYKEGIIDGNLCNALCVAKEIYYEDCFNYRHRKLSLKMKWNGRSVMLKALYPYLEDFNTDLHWFSVALDNSRPFDKKTSLNFLRAKLSSQVNKYVQFRPKPSFDEIYQTMWTGNSPQYGKEEIISIGALSLQREYIFLQFYKNTANFPDVLGTCGHMYLVEYTPPTWTLNPGLSGLHEVSSLSLWTWERQAKLALAFLEMLRAFEQNLHDTFYFCDIKHPNFGFTEDLVVKAIDVDMAYFKSTVDNFMTKRRCVRDTDQCQFFDCLSECDLHTGWCKPKRINNNLQVVCKKIFIGDSLHPGLLRSPPQEISKPLDVLLDLCANYIQEPNIKTTNSTLFHSLQGLLKQTIPS